MHSSITRVVIGCSGSIVAALVGIGASPALAQSTEATGAAPTPATATAAIPGHPEWTIRIELAAWYASAEGDLRMPGPAGSAQSSFELENFNLDEPSWTPMGFVHVQLDSWRISAGGFGFSNDGNTSAVNAAGTIGNLTLAQGDLTRSSLDFWSVEVEGAYRLIHAPVGTMQDGRPRMVFGLEPLAGVRMYSSEFEIASLSSAGVETGRTSSDDFFIEPIVGIKLDAEFAEQFTIDFQTDMGIGPWGDADSWSWDIIVGGSWRPIPNVGVRIGYRHLFFDLESGSGSDSFKFDGSVAGLFAGVEIRF